MFCLVCAFCSSGVAGQSNATLNILTLNSGQVTVGQTVDIQVTVGNTGPTSSIGVNKVRPQISVPAALVNILPNAQQTGLPPGWIILSNTGSVIQICNGSDVIPVGAQRQIFIKMQGNTVGGPSTITGNLSFGPGTGVCTGLGTLSGDLPADNSSNTTIQVNAALPCSIAVSASAGTIVCNGGTTTLTATATGANGSVEYSLNGGAYQSANTFTINAAGSPYTITAREVTNPTCMATSTPVNITEPAIVPAPTINVVQPTCTLSTGTITITSSTTGLTFSLDGGSYAVYPTSGYVLTSGVHTLTAQNSSNCISAVTNITVDAQPSTPSAPAASVVQPTCTINTGTITITSSTTGLTFSLDGGAYAAYPSGGYSAAAGVHTLTAQNSSNCISAATNITVDAQPSTPSAPAASVVQPTCTITTGTITITSSTTGLTFSLDGSVYAAYPSGGYTVAAGAYTLTSQNSNNCISGVTNITVNAQPPTPSAPTVSIVQSTCTVPTGTITITSSTTGLTFSLDGGAYEEYPSGGYILVAGAHTLTAQNSNNCTSSVTNIIIDAQPPTPSAPIVGTITQPSCLISTGSVELNGLPAGNWVINPGSILGSTSLITINGLAQGTYNFTVTNAAGCTSQASGDIVINNVPGAPSAPTINVIQPTCTVSTGTIIITSTIAGLTFSLDGGVYSAYPSGGYVVAAGAHTLSAQNIANCISTSTNVTINVQPPTPPAPTLSILQPTCTVLTGTITITSSNTGLIFSLDGGAYAAYPSGGYIVTSGSHTLTAQNINGCISSVTNITIDAQPVTPSAPAIGTITQPTCIVLTGSVDLNGLPSGNWSLTRNPGGIITTGNTGTTTVSGLAPGTYNFNVTNSASCISSLSADVVISVVAGTPTAPTVNVVQPTCTSATGTITITSTTTGLTFSLDGAPYSTYPSGGYAVTSGAHSLTAQNAFICTSPVTNINIDVQPLTPSSPAVNVLQPTCTIATGTITITSSTTGLTFSLDGGVYSAYPSGGYVVTAGAHTLTAQNSNNCISTGTNITVDAQPPTPSTTIINIVQPTCTVATGTISITSSTTGLTFSLDGGAYAAYPSGGYVVAAGAHTLTAQNSNSCISGVTNIIVNAQPATPSAPTINIVQPTCTVATGTITITSSTTGLTFSLDGGAYAVYPSGGYIVSAGAHTLTAQNARSCISAVINITVNAQPVSSTATASAGVISCNGGTTTLTVTASGGTAPFLYSLNGAAYQAGNIFTVGAGTYSVTVQNAGLCTVTTTAVTVTQPLIITASLAAGSINCNGGTATLTVTATGGTGVLQYSLNGGAFQSSNIFTAGAGTHRVTVKDANGCTVLTNQLTVGQPSTLTASATAPRITQCGGTTEVLVTASGGRTPYIATGTFTRGPGTWSFTITDAGGCSALADIIIEAPGCINLKVFPNPSRGPINIFHSVAAPGSTIQLFNVNGQRLLSKPIATNSFQTTLDLSRFSAGSYIVVFFNGNDKKSVLFEKISSN